MGIYRHSEHFDRIHEVANWEVGDGFILIQDTHICIL